MSASIHDKLERVRKPRVHIRFDVEHGDAMELNDLPFVVGVLGDFSGDLDRSNLPSLAARKFVKIDRDTFDDVMARFAPELSLRVENTLAGDGTEVAVQLKFNSIDDFAPAAIVAQVPQLRALLETRQKLRTLMSKADVSEKLEGLLEQVLQNRERLDALDADLKRPSLAATPDQGAPDRATPDRGA